MKLWKMSRTETKRLFSITNITSTLCVSLLIITVCTVTYIRQHGTIDLWFYNMFHEIFCGGYFVELLFIPLGYFVTTNVCTDVTEKVFRLFIARADTYSYIIAKYMIGILFSFVMSMIVLNFFAAVGMSVIPVTDEGYYSGGADVYEDLLKRNTFLYFEMRILFASLITSVFAAIGMIFSAVIQNQYVSALSPYLAYTMITRLQLILGMPERVDFSSIYSGFLRTSSSVGWSVAYIVLFCVLCLVLTGFFYVCVMKRRCSGEKT